MIAEKRIAVVLPAYNAEKTILKVLNLVTGLSNDF
jgi:glycosyltransferase involved in cell wall biosynthesis